METKHHLKEHNQVVIDKHFRGNKIKIKQLNLKTTIQNISKMIKITSTDKQSIKIKYYPSINNQQIITFMQ